MSVKMALASNGKRSVYKDYVHAKGDSVHQSMKSRRLNLQMVERETVVGCGGQECRYLGGFVGNKEVVVMSMIAVALYLINGEYAQTLCTALTSVPPAIFSYRVVINQKTSKEGYHSILFYWSIYGVLALVDQFIGAAQGYNLIKSGLLGSIFFHAIRTNPTALPAAWLVGDKTADLLTSIFSRYDSNGFAKKTESSGFEPQSPTFTHYSEEEEEQSAEAEENADDKDLTTACSFAPSLAMQTTQKVTPGNVDHQTPKTMLVGPPDEEQSTVVEQKPRQFETTSAMTMSCHATPDIVTVPSDKIVFSVDNREICIRVTNVSPLHIMFALKTNADTYLIAAPTTGVLRSGQSMTMRVGVTDKYFDRFPDPASFINKLAIDYTTIPQHCSNSSFSPLFFQSQNRRRHAIRVFYK